MKDFVVRILAIALIFGLKKDLGFFGALVAACVIAFAVNAVWDMCVEDEEDSFSDAELDQLEAGMELEELERLAALKEKGVLTDEEFQIKKKQLLNL